VLELLFVVRLFSAAQANQMTMEASRRGPLPGLPRHVRINTLKTTYGAAKRELKLTGHLESSDDHPHHGGGAGDKKRAWSRDPHAPDLLVFKRGSNLSKLPLVESGALILQQKASCFPALALAPPVGGNVIDACAAPGNKVVLCGIARADMCVA
jgi:putative methyltransferase